MKPPLVQFDPGAATRPELLKWTVTDYAEEVCARFAHRDDAELYAQIIKRRPYRAITRELRG